MPAKDFLDRISRFFEGPSEHFDSLAAAIAKGRLKHPVKPMTDQELALAIREFRNVPPSPDTIDKLGADLAKDRD